MTGFRRRILICIFFCAYFNVSEINSPSSSLCIQYNFSWLIGYSKRSAFGLGQLSPRPLWFLHGSPPTQPSVLERHLETGFSRGISIGPIHPPLLLSLGLLPPCFLYSRRFPLAFLPLNILFNPILFPPSLLMTCPPRLKPSPTLLPSP